MNSGSNPHSKHLLVAPLDWGLGHAARCVPLIRGLTGLGHRVTLAAEGAPLAFLRTEFPDLDFVTLPGYGVTYPQTGSMALRMTAQLPALTAAVRREHVALRLLVREITPDAVISDNRFGLYADDIPSVYISHQLRIKCPPGFGLLEPFLARVHRRFITRFTRCWVPDLPGGESLAGELSQAEPLPRNARFIGLLSRFSRCGDAEPVWDVVALVSGPEPQRSLFERLVVEQLSRLNLKALVVAGRVGGTGATVSGGVRVVPHLESTALQRELCAARMVLARPGYSTLMDLAVLGRPAVLVPTPGQTEQEYLARRMMDLGAFYSEPQRRFDLSRALRRAEQYRGLTRTPVLDEKLPGLLDELF